MSVKIKDNNRIPDLLKELEYIDEHIVRIGVLGEDDSHMVMIASVNEFGVDIQVTEKMRKYLHKMGLHLKKSTTKITIPERSFIRSTFDENEDKLERYAEKLLQGVLDGKITGKQCLERIGEYLRTKISSKIRDIKEPPNHPFTQKMKAIDNPLIDSGRLRQSITYEVVKK